jgi:hypothetical protein
MRKSAALNEPVADRSFRQALAASQFVSVPLFPRHS